MKSEFSTAGKELFFSIYERGRGYIIGTSILIASLAAGGLAIGAGNGLSNISELWRDVETGANQRYPDYMLRAPSYDPHSWNPVKTR